MMFNIPDTLDEALQRSAEAMNRTLTPSEVEEVTEAYIKLDRCNMFLTNNGVVPVTEGGSSETQLDIQFVLPSGEVVGREHEFFPLLHDSFTEYVEQQVIEEMVSRTLGELE